MSMQQLVFCMCEEEVTHGELLGTLLVLPMPRCETYREKKEQHVVLHLVRFSFI